MKNKQFTGIIFIIIGLYILLKNIGIINWSFFTVIADLWPLFLIASGLQIISNNKRKTQISIFIIITFIFFGYGFYLDANSNKLLQSTNTSIDEKELYNDTISSTFSQIAKLEKNINALNFDLNILAGSTIINSASDNLLYDILVPESLILDKFELQNSKAIVQMYDNSVNNDNIFNINFSKKTLLDLNLNLPNSSENIINYSDLLLNSCNINTSNSTINITLGSKNHGSTIRINGANNNLILNIPENMNLNIFGDPNKITWLSNSKHHPQETNKYTINLFVSDNTNITLYNN